MAEFWRSGACTVWVEIAPDSQALVFTGLDRAHLGGYEYSITVPAAEFAAVRRALGAAPDTGLVELLGLHAESLMTRGERSWLDDHGIGYRFHSW